MCWSRTSASSTRATRSGGLAFGTDGALYFGGGDGASFNFADYGQDGNPRNPCGDPPGAPGAALTPPTAEGGALRAQDIRTSGDPAGLNGSISRVNPDTGAALPDNPAASSSDPNVRRIVATGLRNPFRIAMRPGTNDLFVGDVGWSEWEEINRMRDVERVRNYGWPCYEGPAHMPAYDSLNLDICENMYGTGAQSSPLLGYRHSDRVTPGEACSTGSSSISGLAFDTGPNFPDSYRGSLFFSDYSRSCIWVMSPLPDGTPDTSTLRPFATGAIGVVELQFGLDGALYYPDLNDGTIKRIASTNHGPTARASATPTSGRAPLSVAFNGSESSDPDDDALSFAWDLDGDGGFDDSTSPRPTFEYTDPGVYHPRLRVRDAAGDIDFASLTITAGAPPTVSIGRPTSDRHWAVGELVTFAGSAHDFLGARLASSRLSWQLNLRHCSDATTCHTHPLRSWTGVASGSFNGPDHEYPSHLELSLTATDSHGLSATKTVRLDPKIVTLYFRSSPSGLRLSVGDDTLVTPFSKVVILNSVNSVAASSPQYLGGGTYGFGSWSDGGRAAHEIVAHPPPRVFTATYNRR